MSKVKASGKTWGKIAWNICAILWLVGFCVSVWWIIADHTLWGAKLVLAIVMAIGVAMCLESSQRCAIGYSRHTYEQFPLVTVLFLIVFDIYVYSLLYKLTWIGYLVIALLAMIATALIMRFFGGTTAGGVFAICTGGLSFGAFVMATCTKSSA